MLTIIIFTNNRDKYLSQLMNDILSVKTNIQIYIINYSESNRKQLSLKKKKLQKNIKIIFDPRSKQFSKKLYKYIQFVKTKYVWFISDDDRIDSNYIKSLLNFLKTSNQSGFTLNHTTFRNEDNIIKEKIYNIKNRKISLNNEIHQLGLISSQIFNIKKFNKIKKDLDTTILLNNDYPHIYIALMLNKKFNDWNKVENKIVLFRYGNLTSYKDKNKILTRLDNEFKGYLDPLKKLYKKEVYKILYNKIFFKNIVSWILLSIEQHGKTQTLKIIEKNRDIIPVTFSTLLVKKLIFLIPIKILILIKKIKRIINKY
jgi:hypothetical protein